MKEISDDFPPVTDTDRTGEASITDADTIQLSTTDTTGSFLVVTWLENE